MNITREQIMAAKAGGDLDCMILELLGYELVIDGDYSVWKRPDGHTIDRCGDSDYSTDICNSFELQAEIERRGLEKRYVCHLILLLDPEGNIEDGEVEEELWAIANAPAADRARAAALTLLEAQTKSEQAVSTKEVR
jgi:hypothetical protein